MQSILGSGGSIGSPLAKELRQYTDRIRLVSRNPEKINPQDELMAADLTNTEAVHKAVAGSSVIYVCVGFPYYHKVWKDTWPKFIKDVIAACKEHQSKMVFFDNVYMYDRHYLNGMDENTPINPSSKKGKVRAELHKLISEEFERDELDVLIARSADFYGPGINQNGMIREMVFKPLAEKKKGQWLGSDKYKHSVTYVPDAAKATALLGNTPDAYNQVWHLPTSTTDALTGKQWVEMAAHEMGLHPRHQVAPKWLVRLMGVFVPIMRELHEMLYQYDRDYVFDSSKFEKRFALRPTSYRQGIREVVRHDYPEFFSEDPRDSV